MTNDAFTRPPTDVLVEIGFGPRASTIIADGSPAANVYENVAR